MPQHTTIEELKSFDIVYLATPYSKYPKGIERAFTKAARITGRLIAEGVNVFSPIAHTHSVAQYADLDPLDHKIWLPYDEAIMNRMDALVVCMMEGWEASYGLKHEIRYFISLDKAVLYLDPNLVGERP